MKLIALVLLWTFSTFAQEAVPRKSEDDLSFLIAEQRKTQVKNIKYDLSFELEKGSPEFKGLAILEVELARLDLPLTIDFLSKKIESVKVNGELLTKYPLRKGSFDIPQKNLAPLLKIEVKYIGEFSKEASGFKRVIDPADQAEYLYTDFEPYYAHWLFPALDQPDLKAKFKVTVTAPSEWKVIQNELIESETKSGNKKVTKFHETKPLSTYLFFLGAGPFVEWKDNYGDLPLYLYARKSLEKYVDADEIMKTTKAGLKFFNDYFNYPYPFSKYGHVFIPEFAWGGMENPGAVTMNERGIFRGPVPQMKYDRRNSLILHEMAHMWFGDLVTMEWWNDLWLNESFATYLASIAQDRALDSELTWLNFFHTKTWGYWQDQLVTTHPIETIVPDVRSVKGNFDGITYAKGASALKQLHFYVGEEAFREGLRSYFKKYAFQNTQRVDFINAIATAAKKDLTHWTSTWLQTAGPNRVKVKIDCSDDEIKNLSILQTPSVSKTLSPHRTRLAFYEEDGEELDLESTFDAVYSEKETSFSKLKGEDCPDFIFPNKDDLDYALFSLDEKSLKNSEKALVGLPEPLTRLMLWNVLVQMVRDAELKPKTFFSYALKGIAQEKDEELLASLLGRSLIGSHYYLYLTEIERSEIAQKFEEIIFKRMMESEKGSSLQMSFFDFYVAVAQSPEAQKKLFEMLTKNTPPEGIVLDQDRRWSLILSLSSHGHPKARELVAAEVKKDNSTIGKRTALAARAAYPDLEEKKKIWQEIYNNKDLTHSDKREAGSRLHDPDAPELSQPFVGEYFKRITQMDWKSHDDVVDVYFRQLYPLNLCSKEVLKQSEKGLKKAQRLSTLAKRSWREAQDELKRCVNIREMAQVSK